MADGNGGYWTNYSYAPPSAATAWRVEERPGSGTFLTTVDGVLLCRFEHGLVCFWDKLNKDEVKISINHLSQLANGG